MIIGRIIFDLVIALAVINGWWFVALPLGLIAAWKYPGYIEILVAGVAYDALFGLTPATGALGYVGTIVSVLLIICILVLKKIMR